MTKQSIRSVIRDSTLASLVVCALINTLCEDSQAQFFSGGFNPARVVQLRWISSTSSSYTSTYIAPGVNGWNGISSRVSFSQVSSGPYDVRVVTEITGQSGLLGRVIPYCSSGGSNLQGEACVNVANWGSVKVIGYTNQIEISNLNTTQIISSVYCHEFGHVLSLAHTNPSAITVMTPSTITSYLPQALDKLNLRAKWGN
jgi:hypothetical protein